MIGALSILERQPCLIAVVNDGSEPDLVMVEPLQFIPAAKVYSAGRNPSGDVGKSTIHALPSKQEGR